MSTAENLILFVQYTLLGQESALFKMIKNKNDLKDETIRISLKNCAIYYLNSCYKSLILKNDQYITEIFKGMETHREICLLNIIAVIIQKYITDSKRENLNISSYDSYMGSVKLEVLRILDPTKEIIQRNLLHNCSSEDISKCNPDEPMFF